MAALAIAGCNPPGADPAPNTIVVTQGSTDIKDYSFGTVTVGHTSDVTCTIVNQSSNTVSLDHIAVEGTNTSEFEAGAPVDTTLVAGASTTFSVTFTPSSYGTRTAQVTVYATVATPTQYTFDVNGIGTCGAFQLADASDPTTPIQNGATSSNTVWKTEGIIKNYIITNTGPSPLYLLPAGASVVITGDTDAISLSSPQPGAAAIAASGTQNIAIQTGHTGLLNGTYSVTVAIQTSDATNPTFSFHIYMDYHGL